MIAVLDLWLGADVRRLVLEVGAVIVALVLVFGGFRLWLWRHDVALKGEIVKEINDDADKIARKAADDRLPADKPGAADRLRRNYCRDCRPLLQPKGDAASVRQ